MYLPLFVFLLLLFRIAGASDGSNYFINPSTNTDINPVWTLGEQQVISWETTLEVFNVSIWQQSLVEQGASSQGNVYSKIHTQDQVSNFTWVVQYYGFNPDYSNVYFFWINPDGPNGFVSSFFNITAPPATATATTSGSTSTSTSSANGNGSTGPSTSATSTISPGNLESSPSGLDTTSKIALGVGIGVGVPILGGLIALIWLTYMRANNNRVNTAKSGQMASAGGSIINNNGALPPYRSPPSEIPGSDSTAFCNELPGH